MKSIALTVVMAACMAGLGWIVLAGCGVKGFEFSERRQSDQDSKNEQGDDAQAAALQLNAQGDRSRAIATVVQPRTSTGDNSPVTIITLSLTEFGGLATSAVVLIALFAFRSRIRKLAIRRMADAVEVFRVRDRGPGYIVENVVRALKKYEPDAAGREIHRAVKKIDVLTRGKHPCD